MNPRLVHLSDTHFGREDKAAIDAAVALAHDLAPSITVVTGDLTLAGRPAEFIAARAFLDRLPAPVAATPGNHDTPYFNLALRSLAPFRRWRRYIGPDDCAIFEAPGVSVATINTARGAQARANWAHGAIDLSALAEVAARLRSAERLLRVLACHHPLIDLANGSVSGGVRRGHAAAGILCEAGVDLVLTGHTHLPFAGPMPIGDGRCYAAGAGTLSLRARGEPASLSVIDAGDETITITAHAWTGSRFEPFRAWDLPRRNDQPAAIKTAEAIEDRIFLGESPDL